MAVVGFCEYGVLTRPGEPPFLLRYYPKAIAGKPDEVNQFQRRSDAPLEIMSTIDANTISLVALADGRPVPNAVFHLVDSDLTDDEITADADGRAQWSPGKAGTWSAYVKQVLPAGGDQDGRHYDEIRQFTTLCFTWPLERDKHRACVE